MNDKTEPTTLNKLTGCPVAHNKYSLTAGKNGPVVVTDLALLEKLQLFNREKIPARNVHALGVGVYGEFTVTNPEISKYTCAKLFSQPGKKTQLFARFSGIFTEQGDSDTMRDPRGFAIKFYTEEGNWDLLGIDTPVFNVRDAKLGPDAVHSFKRDPRTGMWNPTQSWDFATAHPESFHQLLMIYSDRSGTPISYRKMNAYGCHTFSFINAQKQRYWVKFHIKSLQGAQGFTNAEAKLVAGEDPNFLSRDLIQAVGKGDFPKWKMYVQIMEDAEGYKNPWTFDATKVWLHKDYPLIEVGEIVINRNVTDYFAETEQVAFSPSTTVPGIGLSPDRLLMGRLLIYDDTQHHRIGANFKQLPVNRPNGMALPPNTHHVGGEMNLDSRNHYPHYADSIFGGANANKNYLIEPEWKCDGNANYYPPDLEGTDSDYYEQPGLFYRILSDQDKINLSNNLASSLEKVTSDEIIRKAIYHLKKCDANLGSGVETLVYNKKKGSSKTQNEVIVERIANSLING